MSESTEMYLVTIARLNEAGVSGPVPISRLAERLDVLPVSANQMVRKLEAEGLLSYEPYSGVELTDLGVRQANQILRRRLLWEVFLVHHLNYAVPEADGIACRLEHTISSEATERLAEFLGNPTRAPGGERIPGAQGDFPVEGGIPLSELGIDQPARIVEINLGETEASFLASQELAIGGLISLAAIGEDGSILMKSASGGHVQLSWEMVDKIRVKLVHVD